jgi:hypothetical protein
MGSALNDDKTGLSDTAKIWKREFDKAGITRDMLSSGIDALGLKIADELKNGGNSWVPDVFEMCHLCRGNRQNLLVPSLDRVVSLLAFLGSRQGSIVDRYEHPIVFAVAQEVDMHVLRLSKTADIRRMVKPVYEHLLAFGYPDFPDHAFEQPKALDHKRTQNFQDASVGFAALAKLRVILA